MAKRALLAGCNYPGTNNELKGCINDVHRMSTCLTEKFGFDGSDITLMIDTDENSVQPTGKNIKKALTQLVQNSEAGDVLYFHYSGHGTQVSAESGDVEDDGKDEAIVPTDLNLITDDDFRLILGSLPEDVSFTFVADSCHSGGLLDSSEIQIGEDEDGAMGEYTNDESRSMVQNCNKSLSEEALAQMLGERSGHTVKPGQIRTTLYDMFGEDSSPTIKVFMNHVAQQIQDGFNKDNAPHSYVRSKLDEDRGFLDHALHLPSWGLNKSGHANAKPAAEEQLPASTGVLVSGCQSDETSADQRVGGDAYGALSNSIKMALNQSEETLTNAELVTVIRKLLKGEKMTQNPCLSCSDENVSKSFICPRVA